MVDKVIFSKYNITTSELAHLQEKGKLRRHEKNGKTYYDNKDTKDFNGGFFIQVDTHGKLKATGSVHKFRNFLRCKRLENYDRFTMQEARQTITEVLEYYGLPTSELFVKHFEIGANIPTELEPHEVLNRLEGIKEKQLYYNPKYKNESMKITPFHKDFKRVYKVYDKLHEMKDKRRKPPDISTNIIRLETEYRRVQKIEISAFLRVGFLEKLQTDFITDFTQMEYEIFLEYVGKGKASSTKTQVAKSIIQYGTVKALEQCKEKLEMKEITPRQYRTQREFIRDWFSKELYKDYKVNTQTETVKKWTSEQMAVFQSLTLK